MTETERGATGPGDAREDLPTDGLLVAAHFVWDEYPGLRVGRLVSGQGDLGRHPRGETHAVATAEASQTACGLSRAAFPNVFAPTVRLGAAEPCPACGLAASVR